MVVASPKNPKKPPVTLQLSPRIDAAIAASRDEHGLGPRQKWVVVTAAVLALLSRSKAEQWEFIKQTLAADAGDERVGELLARAVSGDLAKEVRQATRDRSPLEGVISRKVPAEGRPPKVGSDPKAHQAK